MRLVRVPHDEEDVAAAIAAAGSEGCVCIAAGTHVLRAPLAVADSVHILGDDDAVGGGAVLRLNTGPGGAAATDSHMITVVSPMVLHLLPPVEQVFKGTVRLSNLTLVQARVGKGGVEAEGIGGLGGWAPGERLVFAVYVRGGVLSADHCRIATEISSAVGVSSPGSLTLLRCSLSAPEYGTYVGEDVRCRLRQNHFQTCHSAVLFQAGSFGTAEGNLVEGCRIGMEAGPGAYPVLRGNEMRSCGEAGVYIRGCVNAGASLGMLPAAHGSSVRVVVRGNQVTGGGVGVLLEGSQDAEVVRNIVKGCAGEGVLATGIGTRGDISLNEISTCRVGLALAGGALCVFSRNILTDCSACGALATGGGTRGCLRGNTISSCSDGVVIQRGARPSLLGNAVFCCGNGLVVRPGASVRVYDNRFSRNSGEDVVADATCVEMVEPPTGDSTTLPPMPTQELPALMAGDETAGDAVAAEECEAETDMRAEQPPILSEVGVD